MLLKQCYLLIFIILPLSLSAQQNTDSLYVELDSIEVTALRPTLSAADAPVALSTFSRDLSSLNQDASESLTSISDNLPGLWVNNRQNYALGERMSIRGVGWRSSFGVRGIQVILNDIPLTVADGQTMMNIIDPAFIRRVELIRGPASTYWGNSSGGVLSLKTTSADVSKQPSVRLRTLTGSYGTYKGEAEISIASPQHKMSAYSSYLTTNNYRDYSAAKVWRSGINGRLKLTSKSQLSYHGATIYMPEAQHPGSLTYEQSKDTPEMAIPIYTEIGAKAGKTIVQGQMGVSYQLETSPGLLTVSGYGIHRDLDNPLPFGIISVNRLAGGIRTSYEIDRDKVNLQIGVESKLQYDDRTEYDNMGQATKGFIQLEQIEEVWNQALFATGTYSAGKFKLLSGIRYDRLNFSTEASSIDQSGERTFDSVSPSIGLNYKRSSHIFFGNISTSFEAPTTTELVNRPGGGNGFNPNLKPEKTIGVEVGSRGFLGNFSLSYDIAAYRLWIDDMLFPYQEQPNGPTYYENLGQSLHTGIEAQLSWQLAPNWDFSANGDLIDAHFRWGITETSEEQLNGKQIPGIPNTRVRGTISWSPYQFKSSLSYEYVSSYPVDNLNTAKNEQYSLVDVKIGYQKNFQEDSVTLHPFLNINNLMDVRYNGSFIPNHPGKQYFEPGPGRHWRVGVSVNF